MNSELINNHKGIGLTLRTALLSWLVTIVTVLIFVIVIIPQQKRTYVQNLESKAHGIAISLREVAAGAAVNEDYSSVVDHCKEMLKGDEALDYLVVTKNDGFSIISDRSGWRSESNISGAWRPEKRETTSGIGIVPLFNRRVFHYSQPFDHSGIQWGWIHVGISLHSYDNNVAIVYQRTSILAIVCIIFSLLASAFYARQLVRPILSLRTTVRRVTEGDLSARALVDRSDELGVLAASVNFMTEALLRRDRILQSVRFAAQQFLSAPGWEKVIGEVLGRIGEAATACRIRVYQTHPEGNGEFICRREFEWLSPSQRANAPCAAQAEKVLRNSDIASWTVTLRAGESISVHFRDLNDSQRRAFGDDPFKSMLLIPVIAEHAWWGSIAIMACDAERLWTDAECDSLRAAADMLGAAITRQRTQNALLAAKEAAEAANRAKSQFLANMSHEIRTPITGVMGMLDLLQRTSLDDKQRHYVGNTVASAESLLTVIGDVLDFSKIEAGKLEIEEASMSVPDVLDAALRLVAGKAEAKGLEVACRVVDEVPRQLIGDADRLRQVLLNLLSNAVKFTEQGTVVVSCRMMEQNDKTATLRFEVKDTGCGIAAPQQALIFDAFCQADNSMSRTYGGTGLGLTICRQLVQLMGGQIGVESKPGEGSVFWFTVQFKQAMVKPPTVSGTVDFRGLRVLVVDDCAVAREIVCDYIRTWKGMPEEAPEAATGLEKLRRAAAQGEPFSVAVLDWRMPGLDGFALARLIKSEPALAATGLVLLSSFTKTNLASESEAVGFGASLPKPVRKSELYNAIITTANGRLHDVPKPLVVLPRFPAAPLEPKASGTILLAEDNEINQEVASEMLAAMGYHCVRVRTGREALAGAQNGLGELVLMDCQMPEMDGYEATRLIRQWEQHDAPVGRRGRRMPIVALTAHAMKGDRARCLESGMDDYLTKPLEPSELAKTLAHWLSRTAPPETSSCTNSVETSGASPAPVGIDFSSLLHRCMGKHDLAKRLIKKFISQAGADVEELETAIRERDAARLRLVSHRLKGSAANVSAEAVREVASRLEALGREGNLSSAPELLAHLHTSMESIKDPSFPAVISSQI